MTHVLVVDNYDSFVYTLNGYLLQLGAQTTVVRNDAFSADDAAQVHLQVVDGVRPEAVARVLGEGAQGLYRRLRVGCRIEAQHQPHCGSLRDRAGGEWRVRSRQPGFRSMVMDVETVE